MTQSTKCRLLDFTSFKNSSIILHYQGNFNGAASIAETSKKP
ncbi:hypothetical protein HMPREF9089_00146 [Eubacterium brachy ATCC 33089]|nr:hypothetical protein HMPREF9089_00146 [Eubacterium brachy ATCC 33089]